MQSVEKRYLTIRQTARAVGIPEHRIRAWVKVKNVPGFYGGTRFYVDVQKFQQLLDEGRMNGETI